MNDRKRQQLCALNMMIRNKSNGMNGYDRLAAFVELWESAQPFARQLEIREQLLAAGYSENLAEYETDDEKVSCDSCRHDLGGGACEINLEAECREGGGFEAWASQNLPEPAPEEIVETGDNPNTESESETKPDLAETILKWASIGIWILAYPLVIYKLYEWIKYLFF